jgi:hypothetical protein
MVSKYEFDAEAVLDYLKIDIDDDSEAKDGDLGKDSFGVTYKFSDAK